MLKNLLTGLLIGLSTLIQAADFEAKLEYDNPTQAINDGIAYVEVEGGIPPYLYRWSHQSVSLKSNSSEGITEGSEFTVLITDAEGNEQLLKGKVPVKSVEERMNATFKPIV
ncbi:MAG: amino acid carrier protein, partial [Vicingaceae bacterium]